MQVKSLSKLEKLKIIICIQDHHFTVTSKNSFLDTVWDRTWK